MRKLLLHTCCGPCGTSVFERLLGEGEWEITSFYYNPNIMGGGEWERRLGELEKLTMNNEQRTTIEENAKAFSRFKGIKLVVPEQEEGEFVDEVRGMEELSEGGARCEVCFRLRLAKTAEWAKENGYDVFGTTLTVSPHKNAEVINRIGRELAEEAGVEFLERDFKKGDGYKRSIEICRELGIYRQRYCGCRLNDK